MFPLMTQCLVGFGANLGTPQAMLQQVLQQIGLHWNVEAVSELLETKAIGGPIDQPSFHNAAILATTALSPREALADLLRIEAELGRIRRERWGPRGIDLDLLLYGDTILMNEQIMIPHPRLLARRFAWQGAVEIAPDIVHPFCQQTLGKLWLDAMHQPLRLLLVAPPGLRILLTRLPLELDWLEPGPETKRPDTRAGDRSDWQILATTDIEMARASAQSVRATVVIAPWNREGELLWNTMLPWSVPLVRLVENSDVEQLSRELMAVQQGLSG